MSETPNTPRSDEDYILGLLRRIADLESELSQAQARCAELEKAVLGECEECGQTIITPLHHFPDVLKDAELLRFVRKDNPVTVQMWQDMLDATLKPR